MEDSEWLSKADKEKLDGLKKELSKLKVEHKGFAKRKNTITPDEREKWKLNAQRTNQIYIEIKDLRLKNILEAGKG